MYLYITKGKQEILENWKFYPRTNKWEPMRTFIGEEFVKPSKEDEKEYNETLLYIWEQIKDRFSDSKEVQIMLKIEKDKKFNKNYTTINITNTHQGSGLHKVHNIPYKSLSNWLLTYHKPK